jgi:hypothetical protein
MPFRQIDGEEQGKDAEDVHDYYGLHAGVRLLPSYTKSWHLPIKLLGSSPSGRKAFSFGYALFTSASEDRLRK